MLSTLTPTRSEKSLHKPVFLIGSLAYLVLAVLALVFYLERTAFLDIAFHLFYIIKNGDFAIQNNRFGAGVTQIFPLLGSKIGMSLKSIMQLYSCSFVFYYYLVFALCLLVCRSYRFALAMLLLSTIMVTDTFYWIQSEFGQGLATLVLFFALLQFRSDQKAERQWYQYPILFIFIFALVFFHPLLLFPFLFTGVFLYLHGKTDKDILKVSLVSFLLMFVTKAVFFRTVYESGSMRGLKNFAELFPNYFSIQSNRDLLYYAIKDYNLLFLLLFASIAFYIWKRKYKKLLLLCSFFAGYVLLVNVSYPHGEHQFYMENLYLPLSIFVIFPVVFDLIDLLPRRSLLIALFLFLAFRIGHIGWNHQQYSTRVAYLQSHLEATRDEPPLKRIIPASKLDKQIMLMHWATPYEFWLLSTLDGGESRSILATDSPEKLYWAKESTDNFITMWGVFPYRELPEKYFRMKDFSKYYFEKATQ